MSQKLRINIFLKLFYWFLKGVVLISFRVFYGQIKILNREGLNIEGPYILVSNHPSTMMDPLHVACRVNRIVHFLANASLFQTKFTNWFFNTFFCIPVARKKDITKIKIDNEDSFQRAFDFLRKGGCLYIAPEGVSTQEHDLKPLKTGTARVALGAENQNDFALGISILPVGIYYQDAQRFRKPALLNVGQPISVEAYRAEYKKDDRAAVNKLTDDLEKKLGDLMIITDDVEKDKTFRLLEAIQNRQKNILVDERFAASQKLAAWLRSNPTSSTVKKAQQLQQYLTKSQTEVTALGKTKPFSVQAMVLSLFAPLGWLFNLLPTLLVFFIRKKANLYDGYTSTVLVLSGVVFFPIFYRLNNYVLSHWIDIGWWWPLTWLAYGLLGLASWHTFSGLRDLWRSGQFRQRLAKSEEARDAMALYLQIKEELG